MEPKLPEVYEAIARLSGLPTPALGEALILQVEPGMLRVTLVRVATRANGDPAAHNGFGMTGRVLGDGHL